MFLYCFISVCVSSLINKYESLKYEINVNVCCISVLLLSYKIILMEHFKRTLPAPGCWRPFKYNSEAPMTGVYGQSPSGVQG